MKLFVHGGPRLPFGFRLGVIFDPRELGKFFSSPKNREGAFLYVVREHGEWGKSKVGVSQDPRQRLRELQTGNPARLELHWCAVTPGTGYTIESAVKRTGEPLRASGEWFNISPSAMANLVHRTSLLVGEPIQQVPLDAIGDILGVADELGAPRSTSEPFPLCCPWLFTAAISGVLALLGSVLLVMR